MTHLSPADFLRTIYLGDRACKAVRIEGWRKEVVIEVDVVSRIRSMTGAWDYYSEEDITDGQLVFSGVVSIELSPSGPVPNDLINEISAYPLESAAEIQMWQFRISVSSVDLTGKSTEVAVHIVANDLHLVDPRHSGVRIRE